MTTSSWHRRFELAGLGEDRGVVAPLVAIILVVLMAMGAFAVDYGMVYANRRALSTAADSAALAGARQMQLDRLTTQSCEQLISAEQSKVATVGSQIGVASGPSGTSVVLSTACVSTNPSNPAAVNPVVTATATESTASFFGGIFGQHSYSLTRVAKAVVGPPALGAAQGLRPLAICNTDAQSMINSLVPGAAVPISIVKTSGTPCAVAGGGNWSVMDFNGGSNSTSDLTNWLSNSYTGPVTVDAGGNYFADPGNNASNVMKSVLPSLLDTEITVPVYDQATSSGGNVTYRVVGIISAKLCGWQVTPTGNHSNVGKGACYDAAVGMPANTVALQVRYSKKIPPGNVDLSCGIDSVLCKYSSMLVKLVQ